MSDYLNFMGIKPIIKEYENSKTQTSLLFLGPVRKMNILIGANNSRKSRFIRHLLTLDEVSFSDDLEEFISLKLSSIDQYIETIDEKIEDSPIMRIHSLPEKNTAGNVYTDPHFLRVVNSDLDRTFEINYTFLNNLYIDLNTSIYVETKTKTTLELTDQFLAVILLLLSEINTVSTSRKHDRYQKYIKASNSEINLIFAQLIDIKDKLGEIKTKLDKIKNESLKKIYIPLPRNAIRLQNASGIINEDIYKETLIKNYELEEAKNLTFFTGLDFYHQIKTARNSRKDVRENFTAFEDFVSTSFFQNKEIDIIALDDQSKTTNHIHIYFDGDQDKELHHLGDGIQALLILIYPIFMADTKSWVFLEEPEINMHPGLLRLFVKTILEHPVIKAKNLRFFMTTHSNHLLDLSLEYPNDVSIFSFKPSPEKNKNVSLVRLLTGINNTILSDLGVNNSSLFMANCSIWVEGPTDRKILKAFLIAYSESSDKTKSFLEDLHYCFIQYGGSTIANYIFGCSSEDTDLDDGKIRAAFISNKIILIADQDSNGPKAPGKQKGHKLLEQIASESDNFMYHTTIANEVENLLSPGILTMVVNAFLLKKGSHVDESLFDYSDYKSENIGEYLLKTLDKKGSRIFNSGKKLKTEYKNKIADFIVKSINDKTITWEHIKENPDAAELIKSIHQNISDYNL